MYITLFRYYTSNVKASLMHPRDTNTAVCINMWAPGTPAKSYKTVYGLSRNSGTDG